MPRIEWEGGQDIHLQSLPIRLLPTLTLLTDALSLLHLAPNWAAADAADPIDRRLSRSLLQNTTDGDAGDEDGNGEWWEGSWSQDLAVEMDNITKRVRQAV